MSNGGGSLVVLTAFLLIWCCAGLSGLRWGGLAPATGTEALVDSAFAAVLGPFSFLISFLAAQMSLDGGTEEGKETPASGDAE